MKTPQFIPLTQSEVVPNEQLIERAAQFQEEYTSEEQCATFRCVLSRAAWLDVLALLGTDWRKPFLETAPWLIAIFSEPQRILPDGTKLKHYYATES